MHSNELLLRFYLQALLSGDHCPQKPIDTREKAAVELVLRGVRIDGLDVPGARVVVRETAASETPHQCVHGVDAALDAGAVARGLHVVRSRGPQRHPGGPVNGQEDQHRGIADSKALCFMELPVSRVGRCSGSEVVLHCAPKPLKLSSHAFWVRFCVLQQNYVACGLCIMKMSNTFVRFSERLNED